MCRQHELRSYGRLHRLYLGRAAHGSRLGRVWSLVWGERQRGQDFQARVVYGPEGGGCDLVDAHTTYMRAPLLDRLMCFFCYFLIDN